jgi:hypothetical protein
MYRLTVDQKDHIEVRIQSASLDYGNKLEIHPIGNATNPSRIEVMKGEIETVIPILLT